jgi:hypothetical protein
MLAQSVNQTGLVDPFSSSLQAVAALRDNLICRPEHVCRLKLAISSWRLPLWTSSLQAAAALRLCVTAIVDVPRPHARYLKKLPMQEIACSLKSKEKNRLTLLM